jgi:hypothetical protein
VRANHAAEPEAIDVGRLEEDEARAKIFPDQQYARIGPDMARILPEKSAAEGGALFLRVDTAEM